jgi:hypothetical protein
MAGSLKIGDCVRLADGRIGRVRDASAGKVKVRVRRKTSETHEFLVLISKELKRVRCPPGWMSPDGYNRYLKSTLGKLRKRIAANRRSIRRGK